MTKMLYVGSHGPEEPTRATFPFHFAKGALDAGFEAKLLLIGDAAFLMKDSIAREIRGVATPPLTDLMQTLTAAGVEIVV